MLQFWQRLSFHQRIGLFLILFLLATIPTGVYLAQKTQIFEPKATSGPTDFYGTQVSFLKLFGQKSIGETSPNKVTANGTSKASGLVVDKSSTPNKVYVVDTGNNRILGYNGIGDNDGTQPADLVFGQPDFESGACNGDNNLGIFKPPTESTLCLLGYPFITNFGEYWMRANIDVDSEGNLYVIDAWNNRVLKYNQPFSSDKSGGKGDTTADFVWGQDDFTSNGPNKGSFTSPLNRPDNRSLSTSSNAYQGHAVAARGASADSQGNVWVADTYNNRVLRFPKNSKEANVVLGQPDFSSTRWRFEGTAMAQTDCTQNPKDAPLNSICKPTFAKINPETGELFVIDEYGGFWTRILVFKPPFTNGMAADRMIFPEYGQFANSKIIFGFSATGFAFNTFKEGEYANGLLWVNELGTTRTVLLDNQGNVLKTIGTSGPEYIGGQHEIPKKCGAMSEFAKRNIWTRGGILGSWTPGGSLGFDNENNIYIAEDLTARVMRYKLPYEPKTLDDTLCLPEPNAGLFPIEGPGIIRYNIRSTERFGGGIGIAVLDNQLIVQDAGLKVFNNYTSKNIGAAPDFVVGSLAERSLMSSAIDDYNRLWRFQRDGFIWVHQLPFQDNDQLIQDHIELYWADTKEKLDTGRLFIGGAIAFDKIGKALYIADKNGNRVLRVKNYNSPFTSTETYGKLFVDMVIGQPDKNSTLPNHGSTTVANGLWAPTNLDFDNFGNLYVIENDYECQGNARISIFSSEDLKNAQGMFPLISAKRALVGELTLRGPCSGTITDGPGSPVSITFNSKNQMVAGNDGYYAGVKDRERRQLWFYNDPVNQTKPNAYINLPMGASGEVAFDSQDNLIIQDHTWPKVWIINLEQDPSWLIPMATTQPAFEPSGTIHGPQTGQVGQVLKYDAKGDSNPSGAKFVTIHTAKTTADLIKGSSWKKIGEQEAPCNGAYATGLPYCPATGSFTPTEPGTYYVTVVVTGNSGPPCSGNPKYDLVPGWTDCGGQDSILLTIPGPVPTPFPIISPLPSPTPTPIFSPLPTPRPSSSPTPIPNTTQTFYLSKGFNIIGVQVYRTKVYLVKDLLYDLNTWFQGPPDSDKNVVSAVYRFDGNAWEYYTTGGEGNNFTINPGEGYFVLSSKNRVVTLFAPPVKASQIPINKGWSLISVEPSSNFFDAAGLFEAMKKQGIDVSSIYRWDSQETKYTKYEPGSTNNFTITASEGYWVRNDGDAKTFNLP